MVLSDSAFSLELCSVSKSFRDQEILVGATASFKSGQIYWIQGSNGSGKTTMLNIMSGFLRPDSGRVLLAGVDFSGRTADAIARLGVGRLFQEPRLFNSMTVRENFLVALRYKPLRDLLGSDKRKENPAHELADAIEILRSFDYAFSLEESVQALSYGWRKVVAVVQLLLRQPRVILLDEPSRGLDENTNATLLHLVAEFAGQGKLLVVVEHSLPPSDLVDTHILTLERGRLTVQA